MTEPEAPNGELILYPTEDGGTRILCRFEGETLWLTQALMADLFQKDVRTINEHLANIYDELELTREATIRRFRLVRTEGHRTVSRDIEHYSLEAVLAVGYRVRSHHGTQFRQWATARLTEYLTKGFALDDQRLKRTDGVTDYFDELLARIRDIRASESRLYQRVREIFALAADYRPGDREAQAFFAKMQNKMHFAATGLTAAEIIRDRADAMKPNMGLTSWSGGRVLKRDVGTAKNYLDDDEVDTLNRIVVMFLDRAEFRAKRRKDIRMADWEADLDKFLVDTELPVLASAGTVFHELAARHVDAQYETFEERRRAEDEAHAEATYLEDLAHAVKLLEGTRPEAAPASPKATMTRPNGSAKP